ncbi:MAG: YdeI/OmpD-associated family protein, partial [Pseudomonadota bacterium]
LPLATVCAEADAATRPSAAPSYRRNVLRWIKLAKTPSTRAKRIAQAAEFAERDAKIPQM